jgi:hypothetical protein
MNSIATLKPALSLGLEHLKWVVSGKTKPQRPASPN